MMEINALRVDDLRGIGKVMTMNDDRCKWLSFGLTRLTIGLIMTIGDNKQQ